jgi:hypothetical protein
MKLLLLILIPAMMLSINSIMAQVVEEPEHESEDHYWIGVGLGTGTLGFPAGSINLSYQFDGSVITARGAIDGEIFGDDLWDLALLYGISIGHGELYASAGAGVAIVGGERSHGIFSQGEDIPITAGLAIESQLAWRPIPLLGVVLYGFADINTEESFAGVTMGVQVGNLW